MAAKTNGSNDSGTMAEINVIPLVDIILVVLIIFMVAAPLVMKPKIDINLPKSTSAREEKDKSPLRVVLGKQPCGFAFRGVVDADRRRARSHLISFLLRCRFSAICRCPVLSRRRLVLRLMICGRSRGHGSQLCSNAMPPLTLLPVALGPMIFLLY